MPWQQTASQPHPRAVDPRDAFLDEAAHQLRTPLTPLLMLAHLIGDAPELPESLRPHASLLRENVERASRLIDDLADYARLRAGRLRIDHEEIDLATLVSDAIATYAGTASERRVALEAALAPELPTLRGDARRLARLADTLIGNAVQHAEPGTAVVVRLRQIGNAIALTVADQGSGLTPAAIATLFDGENPTRAKRPSHLGVGLAIGHAVAELHGGSLVAHSDGPGRGATFTLRLPTGSAA